MRRKEFVFICTIALCMLCVTACFSTAKREAVLEAYGGVVQEYEALSATHIGLLNVLKDKDLEPAVIEEIAVAIAEANASKTKVAMLSEDIIGLIKDSSLDEIQKQLILGLIYEVFPKE